MKHIKVQLTLSPFSDGLCLYDFVSMILTEATFNDL